MFPEFFKCLNERGDQPRVVSNHEVFFVVFGRPASPVVAAIEKNASVKNSKFMMHMVLRPIDAQSHPCPQQFVSIRTQVGRFVIVRNDADFYAPAKSLQYT